MTVSPPETDPATEAVLELGARIAVAVESQTQLMHEAEDRRRELAASVTYIPAQAAQFAALPYTMKTVDFGPKPGFNWAVQAVAVQGLGTSDQLNLYLGQSVSATVAGYGRFTFTVAAAGAVSTWLPGRTGLVLRGRSLDSIVFGGSIAGAVTVNIDVVQVTDEYLPLYLAAL